MDCENSKQQSESDSTQNKSHEMKTLKIIRLGKIGGQCEWFDFEEIPQGYIHICGMGISKPKRSRKFPHVNGTLINPTEEQVIDYAKSLMMHSTEDPNNYNFVIIEKESSSVIEN